MWLEYFVFLLSLEILMKYPALNLEENEEAM
jgi:hypothetical protein